MALTQDTPRDASDPFVTRVIPIGTGAQLYIGSGVSQSTATGRLVAGQGAARRSRGVVVGFRGPNSDGLGVTDGSEEAEVAYLAETLLPVRTAIRTNAALGVNVFWSDDDAVGGTGVGTAGIRVPVGEFIAFEDDDKTTGWVALGRFASTNIGI